MTLEHISGLALPALMKLSPLNYPSTVSLSYPEPLVHPLVEVVYVRAPMALLVIMATILAVLKVIGIRQPVFLMTIRWFPPKVLLTLVPAMALPQFLLVHSPRLVAPLQVIQPVMRRLPFRLQSPPSTPHYFPSRKRSF